MRISVRRTAAALSALVALTLTATACGSSNDDAKPTDRRTVAQTQKDSNNNVVDDQSTTGSQLGAKAPQPENKFDACRAITPAQLNKSFNLKTYLSGRAENSTSLALVMDMTYNPRRCTFAVSRHEDHAIAVTTRVMQPSCYDDTCVKHDFQVFTDGMDEDIYSASLSLNTVIEDNLVGVDRASMYFYKAAPEDGYCLTCEGDLRSAFMFTFGGNRYFVTIDAWGTPSELLDATHTVMQSPEFAKL